MKRGQTELLVVGSALIGLLIGMFFHSLLPFQYEEPCHSLTLIKLWSYKAGDTIYGLAFSFNGTLGAASDDDCAYIFNPNGNLLNKVCGNGWMRDASYSNGRFGFINDDYYAYITDVNGNLIKEVYVGGDAYDHAITMTSNGFVGCYSKCAFFDFNGNKLWDVDVGYVENGPAYYNGYWYVADDSWYKLLIIKDGSIVKEISYDEEALDTAVCGNYLAVSTNYYLYLYDLSDPAKPKEIWNRGGFNYAFQVAFSPDCKYIAVADTYNHKLKIYDINGGLVLEKEYNTAVASVAWWKDRIAVGLDDGRIYMYRLEGYSPQTTATITTAMFSITATSSPSPSSVLEPYAKLEKLYNEVSSSSGYKALILKGPFQRNVFYLTQLSSLVDILLRLNQFYQDLVNSLKTIKQLMNEKPTLKVVFKIMSFIQRAKVDIALINATLAQADQMERDMVSSKPAVTCTTDPTKIIEGILNANSVNDVLKWRLEAKKQGGLDIVVKCLISKTIDEISKNYQQFKKKLQEDLSKKEREIKNLEEMAKLLSIS